MSGITQWRKRSARNLLLACRKTQSLTALRILVREVQPSAMRRTGRLRWHAFPPINRWAIRSRPPYGGLNGSQTWRVKAAFTGSPKQTRGLAYSAEASSAAKAGSPLSRRDRGPGRGQGGHARSLPVRTSEMSSTGAGRPVQSSSCAAACRTNHPNPDAVTQPACSASLRSLVLRGL